MSKQSCRKIVLEILRYTKIFMLPEEISDYYRSTIGSCFPFKISNMERRLRELRDDGLIEVRLRQNEKYVEYKYLRDLPLKQVEKVEYHEKVGIMPETIECAPVYNEISEVSKVKIEQLSLL